MKKIVYFVCMIFIFIPVMVFSQKYINDDRTIKVAVVKNPYTGHRRGPELSQGPEIIEKGGLKEVLLKSGCNIKDIVSVQLSPEESKEYGVWHRLGLADGHLGKIVSSFEKRNIFTIGLLGNCNSLMGMLAGLQHSGERNRPLKVGLVWIDAHGDFNTPETTLSGMLGGMPVAVSAGLCLTRLRYKAGLEPALPTKYIVMAGVRDVDPLEQELIDRSDIEMISVDDIKKLSNNIDFQMKRLCKLTDKVYVHIDMDVLDPPEIPGSNFLVPGGPTSTELAGALTEIFKYKKVSALGIASFPAGKNDNKIAVKAALNLIKGAIEGIKKR